MNPGAVALGALLGLGVGIIGAIPLLALGVADTATAGGQMVLIAVGLGAQFLAGWGAAHIAGFGHGLHGGLAALAMHAVVSFIALASTPDLSLLAVGSGSVIALAIGTAAGPSVETTKTGRGTYDTLTGNPLAR